VHGRPAGEDDRRLLVDAVELRATALLGEVEVPPDLAAKSTGTPIARCVSASIPRVMKASSSRRSPSSTPSAA
jgi:hypothetical protein